MSPSPDLGTARLRCYQAFAAGACLLAGLGVLVYQGPGRQLVRGALGDVVVMPFLYFGWGVLVPRFRKTRAVGVGLFAATAEGIQLLQVTSPDDPWWLRLILGTTFDPIDLIAYAVGLAAAYVIESWNLERLAEASNRH
jgi:hypothetical protein